MISAGGASFDGIISFPVGGKCRFLIMCGWQHNDSVLEATCSEVNVEMAAFGHVVLLCVVGARFAAAFEQEAQVSQRGYVVYPGVQPQVLESAIFQ